MKREDFYPPACEFRIHTDAAYVNRALHADHLDAADYDQRRIKIRIEERSRRYELAEAKARRRTA